METQPSPTPDLETLAAALTGVVEMHSLGIGRLVVRDRHPNVYSSSTSTEIVTCALGDETERKLFCKYSSDDAYTGHGHWGGVAYEAEVYSHVLRSLELSKPACYGIYRDMRTGGTWIVLEYLDRGVRLNKAPQPESILRAARWLGQFHSVLEERLSKEPIPFLKKHDLDYYTGWSRRTQVFSGHLHERFPWLKNLCAKFEELATNLLSSSPTVIHGEFCPSNILVRDGEIYPVDWESAAIAAGEIDLACLTENWGREIAHACKLEYQKSRWPWAPPLSFEQNLIEAELFLQFRWLGDVPDVTTSEQGLWRFEELRSAGERLGVI